MTRKVLLHDKHVFLEKPFCLDVEQAEELINLAEKKNKILMVGHVVRFTPPYQNLKQWVDSKEFGELIFLSLTRFCGLPGWGQWKEKQVANSSGGALFDLVIHDIDFASYILGSPDLIECSSIPGEMSSHDYISAVWHYKNKNVKVSIEGGNIFHISFPFQAGFIAKFEKVSIHYSSSNGNMIRIADNKNVREVPAGDAVTGYFNETAYFAECLINNSQPKECMPNSSLESIKLCYRHI